MQGINPLRRMKKTPAEPFDPADEPATLPLLWSKGIPRFCDVAPAAYASAATEHVETAAFFREHYADAAGLVWVRLGSRARVGETCDLDTFAEVALPTIRRPFVLVTGDGDASVPASIRRTTLHAILASPFLAGWFTQNWEPSQYAALRPLPIGLDLHTPRPGLSPRKLLAALAELHASRPPIASMAPRAVCDLKVSLNSMERMLAVDAAGGCPHIDILSGRVPQLEIWRRYASVPFVLSARGTGLEAHRTWEALALGAIVIMRRNTMASVYDGLPVVLVEDWREIRDPANLERWLADYAPLTQAIWTQLSPATWEARLRRILAGGPSAAGGASQD